MIRPRGEQGAGRLQLQLLEPRWDSVSKLEDRDWRFPACFRIYLLKGSYPLDRAVRQGMPFVFAVQQPGICHTNSTCSPALVTKSISEPSPSAGEMTAKLRDGRGKIAPSAPSDHLHWNITAADCHSLAYDGGQRSRIRDRRSRVAALSPLLLYSRIAPRYQGSRVGLPETPRAAPKERWWRTQGGELTA